ncbi:MAG: hypothetical protein BWY21_00060 [Parcubacteria group bacterium ADurb.Bin216]|nr:MAG: hypothetical protein BWY21_00060 [Parcubacteria group bacterium ADurb.Bin216]
MNKLTGLCRVCGKPTNWFEPRFLYFACIEHSSIPPVQKMYTGSNMLGIATMHKSNAVPVFSNESAKDISKMK